MHGASTVSEGVCPRCAADAAALSQPQLELSRQVKLLTGRVHDAEAEFAREMQAMRTYVD